MLFSVGVNLHNMKTLKQKLHLERLALLAKGRHHSEKTKNKISVANKGRRIGVKHSAETKMKMSLASLGVKKSIDSVRKMVETKRNNPRLGERASNWKGGATRLSQLARSCFRYRQWRSDVFTRDNFTCVLCLKKSSGDIEADHIKPQRAIIRDNALKNSEDILNCEELWDINNGRTLCKKCHEKTDTYRNKKTKYD